MIKWYWRVYKINGSYQSALDEIGCPMTTKRNIDRDFRLCEFIYAWFDGSIGGSWILSNYVDERELKIEDYEFKGNIGIKQIRKQKIQKIQNEAMH